MTTIDLSFPEVLQAATAGVYRQTSAIFRHRRERVWGSPEDRWQANIIGALGEMAFAKITGRYWEPVAPNGDLSQIAADVGDFSEIRATFGNRGLILHESDPDDRVFTLVVVDGNCCRLAGSMLAGLGKTDDYRAAARRVLPRSRGTFLVPQNALYPYEGFAPDRGYEQSP